MATLTGLIKHKNTIFDYEIFMNPKLLSAEKQEYIINKMGDKIVNGKICLDITKDIVKENIITGEYSVVGFVKNAKKDDEASGTLQYYDWCNKKTGPNVWVNDLCRSSSLPKPKVSTIEVLMKLFGDIALTNNINELNLMIEKTEVAEILINIYHKYGFKKTEGCDLEDMIVMKKPLKTGGTRRTRKKSKNDSYGFF